MAKKANKNDAVMTGILVTRFKMGLINGEDLEEMAKDMSGSERSSAAKKLLAMKIQPSTLAGAEEPR